MAGRTGRHLAPIVVLMTVVGLTAACAEPGTSVSTEEKKSTGAAAPEKPVQRPVPLTAAELGAALLTEEQAVGYTITGGDSRTGASTASSAVETASPGTCLPLRQIRRQSAPGRGESAAAWSTMYRGDGGVSPRTTLLTSYPVATARTRMKELRQGVETCGRFTVRNAYGTSSVTTEKLSVPDLGEEAVRYRLLGRTELSSGDKGSDYSLVTAVRSGGVIVVVETSEVLGLLPPAELAGFKPEPGPDEQVIAAQAEKAAEAERGALSGG
ncbi:hypothetical protein [Streptomyces atroolivaceus]|uniref:hypothetical protein n=1 Tax=Streptomyces atroolivaceus TaxID=66869 RepID=UPI0020243C41|nr:hypothetical protein [Streptomyces atroolivaceus]